MAFSPKMSENGKLAANMNMAQSNDSRQHISNNIKIQQG